MTNETNPAPRGTPPKQSELLRSLGDRAVYWNGAVEMGKEFDATWRWVHSEAQGAWTYRSYLAGDRFFMALSLQEGRIEASLNLKAEEWETVHGRDDEEEERADAREEEGRRDGEARDHRNEERGAEHRHDVLRADRHRRRPVQPLAGLDNLAGLDGPAVAVKGPQRHARSLRSRMMRPSP